MAFGRVRGEVVSLTKPLEVNVLADAFFFHAFRSNAAGTTAPGFAEGGATAEEVAAQGSAVKVLFRFPGVPPACEAVPVPGPNLLQGRICDLTHKQHRMRRPFGPCRAELLRNLVKYASAWSKFLDDTYRQNKS